MSKGYGTRHFYKKGAFDASIGFEFRLAVRLNSMNNIPIWAREAFYRGYYNLGVKS